MRLLIAVSAAALLLTGCSDDPPAPGPASDPYVETTAEAGPTCDDLMTELLRMQERNLRIDPESASAATELADLTGELADLREQISELGC
jgi:hypothetical protein